MHLCPKAICRYSRHSADVFWHSDTVLGIPTTGSYIGPLRDFGARLYASGAQGNTPLRLLSRVLSRARLVERIMLSPEGHSLDKLTRLTRDLVENGQPVVTLSFHSSSLRPGATTYICSEPEVKEFIDRCRQYFDFFLGTLQGTATTATRLRERIIASTGKAIS